jgi:uncharacterized glyoxalase superfamily protein PhnB
LEKRVLTLGLVAVMVAAVGCGGSEGGATTTGDQVQVAGVLTAYYAAQVDGDAKKACGYLTRARQVELLRFVQKLPTKDHLNSCADALAFILDAPGGRLLVRNVEINGVKVSGESAKATGDSTAANGRSTSTTYYKLTKTDGVWKIAAGSGSTTITPANTIAP